MQEECTTITTCTSHDQAFGEAYLEAISIINYWAKLLNVFNIYIVEYLSKFNYPFQGRRIRHFD